VWEGGFRDVENRWVAGGFAVLLSTGLIASMFGITRDLPRVVEWLELAIIWAGTIWLLNRVDSHYSKRKGHSSRAS
jgi:hypothetical protein